MHLSPGDHRRAVEHLHSQPQGKSHHSGHLGMGPGAVHDLPQAPFYTLIERILKEQVLAGVAR